MESKTHSLIIENRNKTKITGVQKVITFNESGVLLNTVQGDLQLNGKDLKVNKLDVADGSLTVEGEIFSLKYSGEKKSLLKKIFN